MQSSSQLSLGGAKEIYMAVVQEVTTGATHITREDGHISSQTRQHSREKRGIHGAVTEIADDGDVNITGQAIRG